MSKALKTAAKNLEAALNDFENALMVDPSTGPKQAPVLSAMEVLRARIKPFSGGGPGEEK